MIAAVDIPLYSFAGAYALLLLVICVLRRCKLDLSRMLIWASLRMTLQLVLAGFLLTYLFKQGNTPLTLVFLAVMLLYGMRRIMQKAESFPKAFRWRLALCFVVTSLVISMIMVTVITKQNYFNAQYSIPLLGMIIGNAMTGATLALKSYKDQMLMDRDRIECLGMLGVHPHDILRPMLRNSMENALLPTINSMLGMGIIFLPGMMTGQILAGSMPQTAVMYQIAIMLCICSTVASSVFLGFHFAQRALYNKDTLMIYPLKNSAK